MTPSDRKPFPYLLPVLLAALLAAGLPASGLRAQPEVDVVISEIMYHPATDDRRGDYIELVNTSPTETHDLTGWRFTSGVSFVFPELTLDPGEYLVVCADEQNIRRTYGITNTVGNWSQDTRLDNGGERIRIETAGDVEVEDLRYDDRPPWPILADGLGHSLERRRLDYDNDDPANWGASGVGSGWTRVRVTGLASSSRLYLYLTQEGSAWVDDVRLHPLGNPGDNRVENGGFEDGNTSWARNGNHSGSAATTERAHSGTRSMKLVATGSGASSDTSVNQDGLGLTEGEPYVLEFWVLFEEPGPSLVARLSGALSADEPVFIETRGGGATPGRPNTLLTDDLPPFVHPLDRIPSAPRATDDVTILATVRDDSSTAGVRLEWSGGGESFSGDMADDGAHGDGAAGDGIWGVSVGSWPTGSIVRYRVVATDDTEQTASFPFEGSPTPELGFYVEPPGTRPSFPTRSNSGLTSSRPAVYHILLDPAELSGGHLRTDLKRYRRGTFIYDGEVFENVRIRHRGQSSLGRPKKHWKVNFNKDHRFRTPFEGHPEVDKVNLQSSEGDKSFLREYLAYKAFMDAGLPSLEMWHVRLYLNGEYRGLYVHMENHDEDWLQRSSLDDEGWLWKSFSQERSGSTSGIELEVAPDARTANDALASFLSEVNNRSGAALESTIREQMDVEAFTDFLALHQLMHNADHPAKNHLIYGDEDAPAGTWTFFLWDADLTHGRNFECSNCGLGSGVWNDCMRFDMWGDPNLLFGTRQRPKCDGPWNGVIDAFLGRTTAFRQPYYDRTEELLEALYHPDVLIPQIEDLASELAPEVARDWQRNPPTYGRRNRATVEDYLFHVRELEDWVRNRHQYLSQALTELGAPDLDSLACERMGQQAHLTWTNRSPEYEEIRVRRNGQQVLSLPGDAEEAFAPLDLGETLNTFRVASVFEGRERTGAACTIVISKGGLVRVLDESFSPPAPGSELAVNCDAAQSNGWLDLTEPVNSQAGSAFFRTRVPIDDFVADFDFRFDEPTNPGADGLVFILNTGNSATTCGAPGGGMGYLDGDAGDPVLPGYAVVFDSWENPGEPSHNWCGFIDAQAGGTPREAVDVPEEYNGTGTFHCRVLGEDGRFTVLLSNTELGMEEREILSWRVPGFQQGQSALVGFSAGTGGAAARHRVDNVVVQVASGEPKPPAAMFSASPRQGEAPLRVTFSDESGGDIDSWSWDFGDGGTSTDPDPVHVYEEPGTYTVRLRVEGPGGDDELVRTEWITVASPVEVVAEFRGSPLVGARPLEVQFTNLSTNASSWQWDFGDGSSSTAEEPAHVYQQAGEFDVTLTAAGEDGAEDTLTRRKYIQVDGAIDADFTVDVRSGPAPLTVQFSDRTTGSTITSYFWDFGDGTTSTQASPSHVYEADGVYDVSLQVFGFSLSDTEEKSGYVRVGEGGGGIFIRGDANGDDVVDISDAIAILSFLFLGSTSPDCQDASDSDDTGVVDLTDAIRILNHLFASGPAPAPPFPEPGTDPTGDDLPECFRG